MIQSTMNDEQRTTAFGLWRFAEDYLNAALLVKRPAESFRDNLEISIPAYFLAGHSIELSLKAFLRARGVSVGDLRSKAYGHNLEAILRESRRRKLGLVVSLTKTDIDSVFLLNQVYKPKELEYIVTGYRQFPAYGALVVCAKKLVQGLKDYCYKKSFN
jgi:hypothetical protein